jgi:prephenate dehydratase
MGVHPLKTTKEQPHKRIPAKRPGFFFYALHMDKKKTHGPETRSLPWAIQGYEGSFHQEAVRLLFGKNANILPCARFSDVVEAASHPDQTAGGLMAMENSIAGSILSNYNLLHRSGLRITGEIYLRIRQHLLVNSGTDLEDIREVHSHTMALQQCELFLARHKWKLVETEDTALSARQLQQHRSRQVAVIASRLAAERYGLEILAPNIHTERKNYTRFLVLQPGDGATPVPDADKASVYFQTPHSRGSLARVLSAIARAGVNLSKLQSFPVPGTSFRYAFHADLEFDLPGRLEQVLKRIRPMTESMTVYGIYKRGIWK